MKYFLLTVTCGLLVLLIWAIVNPRLGVYFPNIFTVENAERVKSEEPPKVTTIAPSKKYTLTIQRHPKDASVNILNGPEYHDDILLSPGSYAVQVEREGFRTALEQVVIENSSIVRQIILEEERFPLFVEAIPKGANISFVDPKLKFHQGIELSAGDYTIKATLEGHKTTTQLVKVRNSSVKVILKLIKGYNHNVTVWANTGRGTWVGIWKDDEKKMYEDFIVIEDEPLKLFFNDARRVRIGNVSGSTVEYNGKIITPKSHPKVDNIDSNMVTYHFGF